MKTSEKKIEEKNLQDSSNRTLDPYAVDFFGEPENSKKSYKGKSETDELSLSNQKTSDRELEGLDWYKKLPKVTFQEADFSNQLNDLPKNLSKSVIQRLKETFTRFTQLDLDLINFDVTAVNEVNLSESIIMGKTPQIYLTLKNKAEAQNITLVMSAEFSSSLIDLVLGGKGKGPEVLRSLSAIEQTIIEFLAINVLSELNQTLGNSDFRLQNVKNEFISSFKPKERGAEIFINVAFGELVGTVTVLLPNGFLDALVDYEESLFLNDTSAQKFNKYKKISNEVAINVHMGETQINANDLLFLEKDDVILIEDPNNNLQDQLTVFVGDSTNYCLRGSLREADIAGDPDILSEEILLEVREIFSEKDTQSRPKRGKMDEKEKQENGELAEQNAKQKLDLGENEIESAEADLAEDKINSNLEESVADEIGEEALASLENVMINLRVNLGGRRLSLSELQKIRVGQIIELGCRPNDPVEVVTDSDNRPIASGELIEIEGQIGVRLRKIFV